MKKENVIVDKTLDFAVDMVSFSQFLFQNGYVVIFKQLARSGTSIGANVWEAQQAESRNDFIHKIKIALKEASETAFWLELCRRTTREEKANDLVGKVNELVRIMSKIVATSKQNN